MNRARGGVRWLVVGMAAVVAAGAPAAPLALEVHDDRVTAQLDGIPVETVLEALSRATGAEVRGAPLGPRDVTATLDRVPLALAMPRLLGEQNFTLLYGAGGRLTAIVLRGGPEARAAPRPEPASPTEAPSPAGPTSFPLVLGRAFTRHRPVPLPGPLAEALGNSHARFVELLDVAATHDDGVRRAEATQVVLSALERESRLRRAFLRSLYALDDETLATLADADRGARFQELLEYLAVHSREPALQKKASVFLEQLRPPAPGS